MPSNRTMVIAGGAGYLGRALSAALAARGDRVIILARGSGTSVPGAEVVQWDGASVGAWATSVDGADAVINLAGRSVNCRYTAANREAIYRSRLRPTAAIGAAIRRAARPPAVWLNASSATIYRDARDREMDELTGEIGSGFSVDVCKRWEAALDAAQTPQTRKVALRSAMVFGPGKSGVLEPFVNIARLGLGGPMAGGGQYVSWIHLEDFIGATLWLLDRGDLSGPVNLTAPNPLPNREFLAALRHALGVPLGLPSARWMLELGAMALGTETELLLKSRRVVPTRLLASGFRFAHPTWREAARALV